MVNVKISARQINEDYIAVPVTSRTMPIPGKHFVAIISVCVISAICALPITDFSKTDINLTDTSLRAYLNYQAAGQSTAPKNAYLEEDESLAEVTVEIGPESEENYEDPLIPRDFFLAQRTPEDDAAPHAAEPPDETGPASAAQSVTAADTAVPALPVVPEAEIPLRERFTARADEEDTADTADLAGSAVPAETHVTAEASLPAGASAPAETSVTADASVPAETSVTADASVPAETSVTADASVPADTSVPAGSSTPGDILILADSGNVPVETVAGSYSETDETAAISPVDSLKNLLTPEDSETAEVSHAPLFPNISLNDLLNGGATGEDALHNRMQEQSDIGSEKQMADAAAEPEALPAAEEPAAEPVTAETQPSADAQSAAPAETAAAQTAADAQIAAGPETQASTETAEAQTEATETAAAAQPLAEAVPAEAAAAQTAVPAETAAVTEKEAEKAPAEVRPQGKWYQQTVKKGDSIGSIFADLNLPSGTLKRVRAAAKKKDLALKPGYGIDFLVNDDNIVLEMVKPISDKQQIRLTRMVPNDQFKAVYEPLNAHLDKTITASALPKAETMPLAVQAAEERKKKEEERLLAAQKAKEAAATAQKEFNAVYAARSRLIVFTLAKGDNFAKAAGRAGISKAEIATIKTELTSKVNVNKLRAGDSVRVLLDQGGPNGRINAVAVNSARQGKAEIFRHPQSSQFYSEGEFQPTAGVFRRFPITGQIKVNSPFNPKRFHPLRRRTVPHNGVDFKVPVGTSVYAPSDGYVTMAGYMRGGGYTVIIKHAGVYSTVYMHLSKFDVRQGQKVRAGQIIARSGNTGQSTGPHLHYELRINDKPVDPLKADLPNRTNPRVALAEKEAFDRAVTTYKAELYNNSLTVTANAKRAE